MRRPCRGKGRAGEYADHQCKIVALSDKFVFASNGMAGLWLEGVADPSDRIILMDTNKEARIAFQSIRPGSDDFLLTVALLWGKHVSRIFNDAISRAGLKPVLGDIPEGQFINGYFFGPSPQGGLVLYMENINRLGNNVSFSSAPEVVPLTDTIDYTPHGLFFDTVFELREGKTERAKREAAPWYIFPVDDWNVLKAVRWVQLTLDDHPGSNEIGGPIDSLTVTATSGVRWYQQKKECQEQR